MKTKIYLTAAAVATLALGSCSQDQVVEQSFDAQPKAIEFGVYSGKAAESRGLETVTEVTAGKTAIQDAYVGFGINAVYTGQNNFTTGSAPNFMYNEQATWNDTKKEWGYTPIKYWPTMNGDKISFFAWAPYGAAGIDLVGHSAADKLTFTVQAEACNMVDFVAGNVIDREQVEQAAGGGTTNPVEFKLLHELSRLGFKVKTSEDLADKSHVVLKSAKLSSPSVIYKKATYTFSDKEGERGTWTDREEWGSAYDLKDAIDWTTVNISNYTKSQAIDITKATAQSLFKANDYLFLIPATPNNGNGTDAASVTFEYDIVTEDTNLAIGYSITEATKTVKLPTGLLKQGVAYSVVFTFNMDQIEVSASVDNWNAPGDQDIDVPFTPDVE